MLVTARAVAARAVEAAATTRTRKTMTTRTTRTRTRMMTSEVCVLYLPEVCFSILTLSRIDDTVSRRGTWPSWHAGSGCRQMLTAFQQRCCECVALHRDWFG